MGFLRLLFALSVVVFHANEPGGNFLFNATAAVNSFFIISGFYMALILDGKYYSKLVFYVNRALRIFPLYWIALGLTLLFGVVKTQLHIGSEETAITHYIHFAQYLSGPSAVIEYINFVLRNLTLIVTKDYFSIRDNLAPGYLIVNQAWTLQIELLFYLAVPFLIKIKRNFLFYVCMYFLIFYGLVIPFQILPDNSLIFSFLSYLFYFLLGLCGYIYVHKKIQNKTQLPFGKFIFVFFVFFIVFYHVVPGRFLDKGFYMGLPFYITLAVSIPYIFRVVKNNRIDRFLGDLSYPVYITHMIFVKALLVLHVPRIPYLNSILIAVPTVIFSMLLVSFIQNPIDRFRHGLKREK